MCLALKHGGPDDDGVFFDEKVNIAFGHRRLSIIDLSKSGRQPMSDTCQKSWITFNGEIYNYLELKEQLLKAGTRFETATDTEVILAAYLQWGTGAFSKLRGMFAFALYDVVKSVTYLVRDSAGIKPLYYYINEGELSFASEIRAFKTVGIATVPDPAWPVRFLALGHIPEPHTTLKGVYSLSKGHFLTWNHAAGSHSIRSYSIGETGPDCLTDISAAKAYINDSLKKAIKRQLISDAPIGVFLSGGIDSSLLSLLANEENEQIKTISIYFNEQNYNERSYQNVVLNLLKGEKFAHLVQQQDFNTFFPHIIGAMDMPTTDGINSWFISKYARADGLKAVLSGVGADELFGGYPSFNRIRYLRYLRKLPRELLYAARRFSADKYRKISFLANNCPLADYLFLRGLFVPDDIAQILDMEVKQVNETLFGGEHIPYLGPYNKEHAAWFETNLYMQNQLLRDTDVLSMSHGLEVRVPFLDEDFTQLVKQLSPGIRFSTEKPKKILIDSFNGLLPEAVWNRPKMGFTFPLQEWMTNHTEISDVGLYRGNLAQNVVRKFKKGELHWSKAFALYQIQLHD